MTNPGTNDKQGADQQMTRAPRRAHQVASGGPAGGEVPPWRGRFLLYLLGTALLAFGLRGIARDVHGWTHPTYWAPVLVLFALAHDMVLVPLVFGVATALGRLVHGPARRYLAAGLALSGIALALAWPGLRGYGRLHDNPSVLPLDYASGLRTALLALWLALLAAYLVRALPTKLHRSRPAHTTATAAPDQPTAP